MDPRRRPSASIAALAWAGVVAGHWIAYLVAVPGANARAATLAETGHGYWLAAVAAAFVLGVSSVAAVFARHLGRGIRREVPMAATARYRRVVLQLAVLQIAIFVVQEILERVEAGAPLSTLVHGGFVLVGIAAQIAVAALVALALTWIGRAAELAGRLLSKPPAQTHARVPRLAVAIHVLISRPLVGTPGSRGPPALLVATR